MIPGSHRSDTIGYRFSSICTPLPYALLSTPLGRPSALAEQEILPREDLFQVPDTNHVANIGVDLIKWNGIRNELVSKCVPSVFTAKEVSYPSTLLSIASEVLNVAALFTNTCN